MKFLNYYIAEISKLKELNSMEKCALVISLINVKGGVGKTTISSNFSHILSVAGYKVLHIDLDPQGSSSELLKAMSKSGQTLSKDDIMNLDTFKLLSQPVNVRDYIFETRYENLHIIPNARGVANTYTLGTFDKRIAELDYPNKYLAFFANLNQIRGEYDYIIIDGQPGMNEMMKVSIIASDYVVSPAAPDLYNLHTVDDTCNVIDLCNKDYGRDTEYLGFFLNNVPDLKDTAYLTVAEFYKQSAKEYFIDNPIRFSKSINKASLNNFLWLEYALNYCIAFPNPCKDLLRLMDKELDIIKDKKENLVKLGVKEKFFD